ncbi:MAG: helix-turn-helix transcriptional regulator [Lachnospiraceae bacterium]|nr:helix-turn-helix transcriptional regulator [Lachnospiraceae bacterium]
MQIFNCGTDFPHNPGEYCTPIVRDCYFISCFSTPFLYEADGELVAGNAGDVLIMPPGTMIYHGPVDKTECFVNDWMYLDGEDFRSLLEKYPLPLGRAFHVGDVLLLKKCIARIEEEQLLKRPGFEELTNAMMTETLISLHRRFRQQRDLDSPKMRIGVAREAFLRQPEKDWSLQEMAQAARYSVSRFCTLYYQEYGCSPKADLLEHRLELGKQMLLYGDYTVTEVSERCGFRSIYYFSKYFKEKEGCTPSEYRKYIKVEH